MLPLENSEKTKETNRGFITGVLWNSLLAAMLLYWGLSVLLAFWGSAAPGVFSIAAVSAAVFVLCAAAFRIQRTWLTAVLYLLPWALLAPWASEVRRGLLLWVNGVLTLWNGQHRAAAAMFSVDASAHSVPAAAVCAAVLLGQLIWQITAHRCLVTGGLFGLALLLLQLLTGTFAPAAWACGLSAFWGLWISGDGLSAPSWHLFRYWALSAAVFLMCALPGAQTELPAVTQLRTDVKQGIREIRYGRDLLPQGRIADAGRLNADDTERLTVQTGQEKTLYLRAFVGADYEDGVWLPLADSAYGGIYDGMLSWLAEQGFDPLTQSASYYTLCDADTAPERNTIRVQVNAGSRSYLYLPSSVETVSAAYRDENDLRMMPKGLTGADSYTAQEYSSSRPAELTVWADWVADPQTEEQVGYVQAEAMYRSFVYDHYTQADARLQPQLEELFWRGYQTENDGIYSAVDRIRTVMKEVTVYDRNPEEHSDGAGAIRDFLAGKRSGNAVLYASAAVQALRAKGIPARYVEGYYLSEEQIAAGGDGTQTVTGQDAHAWVEIYFDGVGWLPVDMTPGYYYDPVELRRMISLPENVRKTAALDGGTGGGENIPVEKETEEHVLPVEVIRDTALILLGAAAAGILAFTLFFLLVRLARILSGYRKKRRYLRAGSEERTRLLAAWIYEALGQSGIDAGLGWKTEETEEAVQRHFPNIEPGEYTRAVELLEKFRYGGCVLEPYELRALQAFLLKITAAGGCKKKTSRL